MRFSKELVVILVLLSLYYLDARPRMEEYARLSGELALLKKQLAREQLFASRKDEIAQAAEVSRASAEANVRCVYGSDMAPSAVMSQVQELLNNLLQKNGLQMVNLRWGDPFKKEKTSFSALPVSVLAQGSPPQVFAFLKDVQSTDKAFSFPIINITRGTQEVLILDVTVTAYQLTQERK